MFENAPYNTFVGLQNIFLYAIQYVLWALEQVPTKLVLWHIEQVLCPLGMDHGTCSTRHVLAFIEALFAMAHRTYSMTMKHDVCFAEHFLRAIYTPYNLFHDL